MADKKGDGTKYILIAIMLAAIAIAIYALYKQFWGSGTEPVYPGPIVQPPVDPNEIPGAPEIWGFEYAGNPTLTLTWMFGTPAHLSTLTGQIKSEYNRPGDWFKKKIGYTIWALRESGDPIKIGQYYPVGGYGAGWHGFEEVPGLNDVTGIQWRIDRWYGFGSGQKFTDCFCEALVVVV